MGWITEVVWPLLIAFISILFRKPIASLMNRIISIRYKDFQVNLERYNTQKIYSQEDIGKTKAITPSANIARLASIMSSYHDSGKANASFQRKLQKC